MIINVYLLVMSKYTTTMRGAPESAPLFIVITVMLYKYVAGKSSLVNIYHINVRQQEGRPQHNKSQTSAEAYINCRKQQSVKIK